MPDLRRKSLWQSGVLCALRKGRCQEEAAPRPHIRRLIELMHPSVTLEQAYREINDPKNRPTPQVTVEAVLLTVRERSSQLSKNQRTSSAYPAA